MRSISDDTTRPARLAFLISARISTSLSWNDRPAYLTSCMKTSSSGLVGLSRPHNSSMRFSVTASSGLAPASLTISSSSRASACFQSVVSYRRYAWIHTGSDELRIHSYRHSVLASMSDPGQEISPRKLSVPAQVCRLTIPSMTAYPSVRPGSAPSSDPAAFRLDCSIVRPLIVRLR